jgi:hypothetical protein
MHYTNNLSWNAAVFGRYGAVKVSILGVSLLQLNWMTQQTRFFLSCACRYTCIITSYEGELAMRMTLGTEFSRSVQCMVPGGNLMHLRYGGPFFTILGIRLRGWRGLGMPVTTNYHRWRICFTEMDHEAELSLRKSVTREIKTHFPLTHNANPRHS